MFFHSLSAKKTKISCSCKQYCPNGILVDFSYIILWTVHMLRLYYGYCTCVPPGGDLSTLD